MSNRTSLADEKRLVFMKGLPDDLVNENAEQIFHRSIAGVHSLDAMSKKTMLAMRQRGEFARSVAQQV